MKDQIRAKIVETARGRGTINYEEVGKLGNLSMGNPDHRNQLADILDDINREEHRTGGPMLSVVVVKKDSRRPGKGFFELARELGRQAPDVDDETFFITELKTVYEYCGSAV